MVIPTFEEEERIAATLRTLCACLDELGRSFEILVVDDGSTDRTPELVLEAAQSDPRLRLLWLTRNFGKGAAVRAGMRAAHGRFVLVMDADLATDLEVVPRVLEELDAGAEVVFGDRRHPHSILRTPPPLGRGILGRVLAWLARLGIDLRGREFTGGMKAYRRRAAREIAARTWIDGRACEAEIAVLVRALGLARVSVPVCWSPVARRMLRPRSAGWTALRDRGWLVLGRVRGRYRGKLARAGSPSDPLPPPAA